MTASPTDFARHLSGYFLRHLACERGLSTNTVASRRTAFTLLIEFCGEREGIPVRKITVATLDRIVVLEDGAIVEDGTHAELSRAGGTYESLWDRQTGAFLEAE